MYILPDALSHLGAWSQFVLVRIAPKFANDGALIHGKTQKYSTWPHLQPTIATSERGDSYTVCQGDNFDAHNPAGWMDWRTAAALAASMPISGDTISWCIGFVITAADPFVCLDIDGCSTLTGGWSEQALNMLSRLPSACEVSISGAGLHVWGWYHGAPPAHAKRNGRLSMELYTEKRFIALGSNCSGQMADLTAHLPSVVAEFFPPMGEIDDEGSNWTTSPVAEYTTLTDDELIHKAMSRTRQQDPALVFGQGIFLASFADLWQRNVPALAQAFPPDGPGKEFGYSEADFALAKELAYWTGKDCDRIERLMRSTPMVRDKWDERRPQWGTLLRMCIGRAVAATERVYHRPTLVLPSTVSAGARLAPQIITGNTYIAREDLAVMFDGCVYIQDRNEILIPNGDIVDQSRFNARFGGYAFGMDDACTKSTKSAWDGFLNNQVVRFPRVEGTEFNPQVAFQDVIERGGRSWVNVYKAPVVDRAPGDVGPFMDLLHKLLPNGDDAVILLSYMAAVVQHPGVKFRWAPFIQGTMGNGKSTLIQCLKHALGHKYIYQIKVGQIENNFNAWLENHILYVADDIYSSKDRTDMMEALKSLITETDQSITYKGIDSIMKRIVGNFIFTDNHKDAMRKQDSTRRICTLYCAQQTKHDRERDGLTKSFFTRTMIPYLNGGGYQAVSEMLHTMPIDPRYNPAGECQEAPETSTTAQAIIDGRTGIAHEVMELVELEVPGFCGNFVSYHMLKKRMEEEGKHRTSVVPLKVEEMMLNLGYMKHPALPGGRLPMFVQPDDTKPILYVKRDSLQAAQTDPALIAALYVQAQQAALTAQTARKFGGIGS